MILSILFAFFTALFTHLHAEYDARKIKEGVLISYPPRVLVRGITFSLLSIIFGYPDLILMGINFLIAAAYFWFAFDLTLNKLRGLAWNYVGSRAWLDRIFRNNPRLQIAIKVSLLIIFIIAKNLYL